jgi:RNA polymerase sigma factor (sigma-70 family)
MGQSRHTTSVSHSGVRPVLTHAEREALVRDHLPLARKLAHEWAARYPGSPIVSRLGYQDSDATGPDVDYLIQEASLALIEATETYDRRRATFGTFAGRAIWNRFKRLVRDASTLGRRPAQGKLVRLNADFDMAIVEPREALERDEIDRLHKKLAALSPVQRWAIQRVIQDGASCAEAAIEADTSRQAVHAALNRGMAKLAAKYGVGPPRLNLSHSAAEAPLPMRGIPIPEATSATNDRAHAAALVRRVRALEARKSSATDRVALALLEHRIRKALNEIERIQARRPECWPWKTLRSPRARRQQRWHQ